VQGLKVTVGRSREEFLSQLCSLFPEEEEGIHKFYDELWGIFCCLNVLELKSLEEPRYLMVGNSACQDEFPARCSTAELAPA
jgi:prolycopene isomerase